MCCVGCETCVVWSTRVSRLERPACFPVVRNPHYPMFQTDAKSSVRIRINIDTNFNTDAPICANFIVLISYAKIALLIS